jgi:hypothetical protein
MKDSCGREKRFFKNKKDIYKVNNTMKTKSRIASIVSANSLDFLVRVYKL